MNPATAFMIDVEEREFGAVVLQRSRDVPVVVDFWAPWCGPCRVLGPVLERLATEMQGAFVLAKVNVDRNQRLAAQYGVQGIPAVKAFRDGVVVDQFTGALPETQVRAWLKKLLPSRADQDATEAQALERSEPETAIARYRAALEAEPSHGPSRLGLGRMLLLAGDEEAEATLRRIQAGTPEYPAAQALLDLVPLLVANDKAVALSSNGAAPPEWTAAATAAHGGRWKEALEHLFRIVQRDRGWRDDLARRTMLAIFALLGDRDPIVIHYRQRLASVLFG